MFEPADECSICTSSDSENSNMEAQLTIGADTLPHNANLAQWLPISIQVALMIRTLALLLILIPVPYEFLMYTGSM